MLDFDGLPFETLPASSPPPPPMVAEDDDKMDGFLTLQFLVDDERLLTWLSDLSSESVLLPHMPIFLVRSVAPLSAAAMSLSPSSPAAAVEPSTLSKSGIMSSSSQQFSMLLSFTDKKSNISALAKLVRSDSDDSDDNQKGKLDPLSNLTNDKKKYFTHQNTE